MGRAAVACGLAALVCSPGIASAADMNFGGRAEPIAKAEASDVRFTELDRWKGLPPPPTPEVSRELPDGWIQDGGMLIRPGTDMGEGPALANPTPGTRDRIDEVCSFPQEAPDGLYSDERPASEIPRRTTFYLNFVGAVLQSSSRDNAAENESSIALTGHQYPVYRGGEAKAIAIAQGVAKDFERWAVNVVYLERPPAVLPYSMNMLGGSYMDTTAGPSGGVATLDCGDVGQRNVSYTFDPRGTRSAVAMANVASQELGHGLGLGHTEGRDRIMGGGYAGADTNSDLIFGNECTPIITAAGQGAPCGGTNRCHCGDREQQNDIATVSSVFAAAGPDTVEPTITILSPEDGAEFEEGESISVNVDVWDDFGGYGWQLVVRKDGELIGEQVDYERERRWNLNALPAGRYEITAEVVDHADHIGTDSIEIVIGEAAGGTDGTDDDEDGGGHGFEDEPVADRGCECGTAAVPSYALVWFWVGVPLLRRRRR